MDLGGSGFGCQQGAAQPELSQYKAEPARVPLPKAACLWHDSFQNFSPIIGILPGLSPEPLPLSCLKAQSNIN